MDDKEQRIDISIPDHAMLWNKLNARFTSYEDDEDIIFAVDPKDPRSRILISKCPYCERANTSSLGSQAIYSLIDPSQSKEVECIYCQGSYSVTYEVVAIPYKTARIKKVE